MRGRDISEVIHPIDQCATSVAVTHYGIGRQLAVDPCIEIEAKARLDDITERKTRRKLLQRICHLGGIGIAIEAQAERQRKAVLDKAVAYIVIVQNGTIKILF